MEKKKHFKVKQQTKQILHVDYFRHDFQFICWLFASVARTESFIERVPVIQ